LATQPDILGSYRPINLEEQVTNYRTQLTLTPVGLFYTFGKEPNRRLVQLFDWSYRFSDGSRLVGQINAQLGKDGNTLIAPTKLVANYIGTDGKTILLSWKDRDFEAFEATLDGTNVLLIASNDNFVTNSMCLVSSESYPRAQVTHWGMQLFKEAFNRDAWSLTPLTDLSPDAQQRIVIDWVFCLRSLCWQVSFNFWLFPPKMSYRWTFHPCFPFFPSLQIVRTFYRSECLATGLSS
jgi:hypothetical protein